MYLFEAHYIDINTNKKITRPIQFEGQFFEHEKECYLYAMSEAFEMKEYDECLDSLEFIAC